MKWINGARCYRKKGGKAGEKSAGPPLRDATALDCAVGPARSAGWVVDAREDRNWGNVELGVQMSHVKSIFFIGRQYF